MRPESGGKGRGLFESNSLIFHERLHTPYIEITGMHQQIGIPHEGCLSLGPRFSVIATTKLRHTSKVRSNIGKEGVYPMPLTLMYQP